ncbi:MAG TPA: hypothetical protein VNQ79_07300 [Blastocatellia bacterium]|nr:hypothetical protein [Blastocatellia bacterium]
MTVISIFSENSQAGETIWRAMAGAKESVGKTAGEALDGLTKLMGTEISAAQFIVQPVQADQFYTAGQQRRLAELMARWRDARDQRRQLPPEEFAELEALIEAELEGSARRAEAMRQDQIS